MRIITLEELFKVLDRYKYKEVHVHHTWRPAHKSFNGKNHLTLQESMRKYHVGKMGWSDIAQHITIFPDGAVMTGRDFGKAPASITGYNTGSFAIENLGNFDLPGTGELNDLGYDKLEGVQLDTLVKVLKYFYNKGCYVRFHNESANKTCPGTGVDKNKILDMVKGVDIMQLTYTSLIKLGSKGNHVKELQTVLNRFGYNCGVADGIAGNKTVDAIKAFQKANRLTADGLFGQKSYEQINRLLSGVRNDAPYKELRRYSSDVHVYEVDPSHFVDVDLGVRGKLETLSTMIKNKIKQGIEVLAGVNCGYFNFNASSEHLGMYVDEGLYYTPPNKDFIDFIYYKDGSTKVVNLHGYDKALLTQLQRDAHWAIGTSYSVVQEGKINLENSEKFPHHKERHPRTLFGQRKDGQFILVCVDGRSITSLGVTGQQSADIMLSLGCHNAVNVDGGGSSTMVIVDEKGNVKVVNKPANAGGKERAIGSSLLVIKNK